VRLKRELTNGAGGIFPAGALMVVTRNFGGLNLSRIEACPKCHSVGWQEVHRVSEEKVDLLPEGFEPEAWEWLNPPIATETLIEVLRRRLFPDGVACDVREQARLRGFPDDALLAELDARGLMLSKTEAARKAHRDAAAAELGIRPGEISMLLVWTPIADGRGKV
jgi:hypothetical protein